MDASKFHSFLNILKESIKLIWKSRKFMALIAVVSSILSCILFLLFNYCIQHLMQNMSSLMEDPHSATSVEFLKNWVILVAIEISFSFSIYAISLVSTEAITIASSISYTNKPLSLQELISGIKRAKTWPFRTTLNISLRSIPFLALTMVLTTLVLLRPNPTTICLVVFLGITTSIYFLYLSVVWLLAVVVSIIEDGVYGKKAIERGKQLVEGQRMTGFMLNIFLNLMGSVPCLFYWIIAGNQGFTNTMFAIFALNVGSLGRVFQFAAYTLLYFEGKKSHGEELIKVHEGFQYSKLPMVYIDVP